MHILPLMRMSFAALFIYLFSSIATAQDAKTLFDEYSDRIYQIRIIELASGKQAALGSGFQISEDGLVVTNYHVISSYLAHPQRYRIEYLGDNNDTQQGELVLLDFDVVNDLALLKGQGLSSYYLRFASELPPKGESIYSIGNPHDLGLTVVTGSYSGITAHSLYERIHFSGSINSGMSGGPALNVDGDVMGVNVATSGNQVSFLIPLHKLTGFVERASRQAFDVSLANERIAKQLHDNQLTTINNIVDSDWGVSEFGDVTIPNEIAEHFRCWGASAEKADIRYQQNSSICSEEEYIYLSRGFMTGSIVIQFDWLQSDELNVTQFYKMYSTKISSVYPDNYAGEDHVSNYECHEDFVRSQSASDEEVVTKATYCARKYLDYPGLYDVLYLGASVHEDNKGLISHFTLAGVSRDMAALFSKKFVENIKWN